MTVAYATFGSVTEIRLSRSVVLISKRFIHHDTQGCGALRLG